MKRTLFYAFLTLFPVLLSGQNLEIPTVDVQGIKNQDTNTSNAEIHSPSSSPFGALEPSDDTVIYSEKKSTSWTNLTSRKDAFFSLRYGLYEFLDGGLTFGNQLDAFTYLFTFQRKNLDDYYVGTEKIYNSGRDSDAFSINGSWNKDRTSLSGLVAYHRSSSGLQRNTNYYQEMERSVNGNIRFSAGLGSISRIVFLLQALVSEIQVSGQIFHPSSRLYSYSAQGQVSGTVSEFNSYNATLRASFDGLDGVGGNQDLFKIDLALGDNFQLFNNFSFNIRLNLLLFGNDFHVLPAFTFLYTASDSLTFSLYSVLQDDSFSLSEKRQEVFCLSPSQLLSSYSSVFRSGIKSDISIARKFLLSLGVSYDSHYRIPELTLGTDGLFSMGNKNVDGISAAVHLKTPDQGLIRFDSSYTFHWFESLVYYKPLHEFKIITSLNYHGFTASLNLGYQFPIFTYGEVFEGTKTTDFFRMDVEIQQSFSKTVLFMLKAENLFNTANELFEGYLEPGFIINAGFRIGI